HARRGIGGGCHARAPGAVCHGGRLVFSDRGRQPGRIRSGRAPLWPRHEGARVMDAELLRHTIVSLFEGFGLTVYIGLIAIGLASIVGLVLALMRVSRSPLAARFAFVYSTCFRGTPLLVQLFILYYG